MIHWLIIFHVLISFTLLYKPVKAWDFPWDNKLYVFLATCGLVFGIIFWPLIILYYLIKDFVIAVRRNKK